MDRIRAIHAKGLDVKVDILRHGLTDEEAILLEALVRLKGVSATDLAKQTGLTLTTVREGVARLAALDYVEKGGRGKYRAIAAKAGG